MVIAKTKRDVASPRVPGKGEPHVLRNAGSRRWLLWANVGALNYSLVVVAVALLLHTMGDRWWFATVLLYSPRWIWGLPLLILLPGALWLRRRALVPLVIAAAIVVGPIMGWRLPILRAAAAEGEAIRVLTCNVQGGETACQRLAELVLAEQPDIVALQECSADVEFSWPPGWHVLREGSLLIASPHHLSQPQHSLRRHPRSEWPPTNALYCRVEAPARSIGFCCVHLQTPRPGLEQVLDRWTIVAPARSWMLRDETQYRRWESEELEAWLAEFGGPMIVAGDFNTPVESAIYRAVWGRQANAFDVAGMGFGYTKYSDKRGWSYGTRIDHILFDREMIDCRECRVGKDVGSDHRPLIAELAIP